MGIKPAPFLDVADGVQAGQFGIGQRVETDSLDDLDPNYRRLMDEPVTGGQANMTPMWFDYEGDQILLNRAEHRVKTGWIRKNPQLTSLLVNPENPYRRMSIKHTVVEEKSEDDPERGPAVTAHLDKIWEKYTQSPGPSGLRDPDIDEPRVLFRSDVDQIATFGKP